ncbi:UPF0481 protein-like protein [Tanacetum coccineum]
MEALRVDHGNAADGIYDTIKVLIDKDNERGKQLNSTSIYRVPETLRNVNKSSYTPRVVSIGPFHAEEKGLKGVEMHKVTEKVWLKLGNMSYVQFNILIVVEGHIQRGVYRQKHTSEEESRDVT